MHKTFAARYCALAAAAGANAEPLYADVPKPCRNKSARKPYPTPMKTLIRRAKEEREARKVQPCRLLEHPPDNGLLVPGLVDVARRVHRARESLLCGVSRLIQAVPIQRCRYCWEVHVGRIGHEIRTCTGPKSGFRSAKHGWRKGGVRDVVFFPKSFHLFDRAGKPRVGHDERLEVPRIPALLELCVQAGLDLPEYPAKRRTKPVYSIDGRIVDFETIANRNNDDSSLVSDLSFETMASRNGDDDCKFTNSSSVSCPETGIDEPVEDVNLSELSIRALTSWLDMISGTKKMMEKYSVLTCGYCPEVQVGPKGHKARTCKASKHHSRDGMHAWQEATIDDVVGPNYVWHVGDPNEVALHNDLKRYYGKAPAVVEMCVQGGAPVPDEYKSMMRLDVIHPGRDEADLVA